MTAVKSINQPLGLQPDLAFSGEHMKVYSLPSTEVNFLEFLALQVPKFVIYRNRCNVIMIQFKDCCPEFHPPLQCDCDDYHKVSCTKSKCDCDKNHHDKCDNKCVYPYYEYKAYFLEYLADRGATIDFSPCDAVELVSRTCDGKDAVWIRSSCCKIYFYYIDNKKKLPCEFREILCLLTCSPQSRENKHHHRLYRVPYSSVRDIYCNDDQVIHPM